MIKSVFGLVIIAVGAAAAIGVNGGPGVSYFKYPDDCLQDGKTPLERLGRLSEIKQCYDRPAEEGGMYYLIKEGERYWVQSHSSQVHLTTWYTYEIEERLGYNKTLLALAIAFRDAKLLAVGNGYVILAAEDKELRGIWSYAAGADHELLEVPFVNLLADKEWKINNRGKSPSAKFTEFLLGGGWDNIEMTQRLEQIKGAPGFSAPCGAISIRAIMPEDGKRILALDSRACKDIPGFLTAHPDHFDASATSGHLPVIETFLQQDGVGGLSVLFQCGDHWATSDVSNAPGAAVRADEPDFGWAQLLCTDKYDDVIYATTIPGRRGGTDSILVRASETKVICIRWPFKGSRMSNADMDAVSATDQPDGLYQPLQLFDDDKQKDLVGALRSLDTSAYKQSFLKPLVDAWLSNEDRYGVLAIADNSSTNVPHDRMEAAMKSAVDNAAGALPSGVNCLLKDLRNPGDHYRLKAGSSVIQPEQDRYLKDARFEAWERDHWLAAFAAWQQESAYLPEASPNGWVTFLTDHGQVWAVKPAANGSHTKDSDLVALTDSVYAGETTGCEVLEQFGQGLKNDLDQAEVLKDLVPINTANARPSMLGYFFGELKAPASTPLKALGASAGSTFPPKLKANIDSGAGNLRLLVDRGPQGCEIWTSSDQRTIDAHTSGAMVGLQDPWSAWVVLMEPGVTKAVRSCGKQWAFVWRDVVWGWSNCGNSCGAPDQVELLKGSGQFTLTQDPQLDYVRGLPSGASDAERGFFCTRAVGPKVVAMDFFDNMEHIGSRRMLLVDNDQLDTTMLQIADGVPTSAARIACHTGIGVERRTGEWNSIIGSYRTGRHREAMRAQLLDEELNAGDKEAWFGPRRVAFRRNNKACVFTMTYPAGLPRFAFTGFDGIRKRTQYDLFVHRGTELHRSTDPSTVNAERVKLVKNEADYFRSWVASDGQWDRRTWMADPLGYFDRVP